MEMQVLGKIMGTASGWDQVTDWGIHFYDAQLNDLGKKFVPDWPAGKSCDLFIDFDKGVVEAYVIDYTGTVIRLIPDWSVCNA